MNPQVKDLLRHRRVMWFVFLFFILEFFFLFILIVPVLFLFFNSIRNCFPRFD